MDNSTNITSLASTTATAATVLATNLAFSNVTVATNLTNVTNNLYSYSDFVNGSLPLQVYNFTEGPREFTLLQFFNISINESIADRGLSLADEAKFNLNITLRDSNITSLTFDSTNVGFEYLAPIISGYFNKTSFSRPVVCTYPISGQYGLLARYLFYVLLVFSLIFRHNIWLSTAALGTAMTYSASAAVHAFALFIRFKSRSPEKTTDQPKDWSDVDLQGIFPVVVAGCIMLTPVLNFSLTIRRNEARPVVVLWGLLLFAAAIGCMVIAVKETGMFPLTYPSVAVCQQNVSIPYCNSEFWERGSLAFLNQQYYQDCECFDLCGTVQSKQPLRRNTQLNPWLVGPKVVKAFGSNTLTRFYLINFVALGIVIVQGLLSLLEAQVSQQAVRNWLYRKLTKGHLHDRFLIKVRRRLKKTVEDVDHKTNNSNFGQRLWTLGKHMIKIFAKVFAAFAYLFSISLAAICVPLFISTVVVNEYFVRIFPSSEEFDAVGQWSTWVGAAFVLIAAIIVRYSPAVRNSVGRGYGTLLRFVKRSPISREGRRRSAATRRLGTVSKSNTFDTIKSQEEGGSSNPSSEDVGGKASLGAALRRGKNEVEDNVHDDWKRFTHELKKPFLLFWETIVATWVTMVDFKNDFVDWWRDPELHSTWDWVIVDDETVTREMHYDELGELYQSWDTKPETVEGLVGPYFRKDRTPAEHAPRYKKPAQDYNELLEDIPRPIQREHTSFNVFAAKVTSLKADIKQHRPDLLPADKKQLSKWLDKATRLLEGHKDPDDYYCGHCSCATHKTHVKNPAPVAAAAATAAASTTDAEKADVSAPPPPPTTTSTTTKPAPLTEKPTPPTPPNPGFANHPNPFSSSTAPGQEPAVLSPPSPPRPIATRQRQASDASLRRVPVPVRQTSFDQAAAPVSGSPRQQPVRGQTMPATGTSQIQDDGEGAALSPPVSIFNPQLGRRGSPDMR